MIRTRRRPRSPINNQVINVNHSLAKLLLIAIITPLVLISTSPFTEARLINIYHEKIGTGSQASSTAAAANEIHKSPPEILRSLLEDQGDQRRATIEFNSPMKRIMDLIGGHHSPVVVVDASSTSSPSPSSSTSQEDVAASAQPLDELQQQQQQPQLQTQQHWTLVDTSQMQQQQQQPTAQQQQLYQTSALPNNEQQYFTFTPFALAPTQSGPPPMTPFGAPTALFQGHSFNPNYLLGSGGQQQMTQSSQNQQQQVSGGGDQQMSAPVQPVFLSSYVPELPAMSISGTSGGQVMPTQAFVPQVVQQQQQSPNSIQQQIQQAHKQDTEKPSDQSDGASKSTSQNGDSSNDTSDEPPLDAGQSTGNRTGSDSGDDEDSAVPGESTGTGSGSSSYEDKYDSDRDNDSQPEGESRARASSSSPPPPPPPEPSSSSLGNSISTDSSSALSSLLSVGLNDDCMQCICRASSGCDQHLRCITIGSEDKFCGPFQMTQEYWQRSGAPGDSANNFSSYEECANDLDCAIESVTKYMQKYFKDCDGDEKVTCIDYARLHKMPVNECDNGSRLQPGGDLEEYWEKFQACAEGYNRTRNGDDEDI